MILAIGQLFTNLEHFLTHIVFSFETFLTFFSGLIGRSWAMLFVGAGYDVCLYDLSADQLTTAKIDIEKQLYELEVNGRFFVSSSMIRTSFIFIRSF